MSRTGNTPGIGLAADNGYLLVDIMLGSVCRPGGNSKDQTRGDNPGG